MAKGSRKRKEAPTPSNFKKENKKLKAQYQAPGPKARDTPPNGDGPSLIGNLLYEDELDTTTETLDLLAKNPGLIGHKALKPFRTAVHDYWRVATETSLTGNSLTSRISSALTDQRHIDALVLLSEMRIREQVPKLGALQRWVRDCDAVLAPAMPQEQINRVWEVLDAILRTTQPQTISSGYDAEDRLSGTRLKWYDPFTVATTPSPASAALNHGVIAGEATIVLSPLLITPGLERRPPNKHPAIIYYSPPNTFPLIPACDRLQVPKRHELPGVPGAFIINDVFEPAECQSFVEAAENVGLEPDEPIAGSATELASVLAHNFIWLADKEFLAILYGRIRDFMPQTIQGGAVKGINARFRLYRYRFGALYRPHIDGAWPASALDETTTPPSYIYDSDPTVYSRLTLLIYLNDNFDGGCTTFFLPSSTVGVLEARPVKPRTGSVCVFPHGAAIGSLLHEGSGVIGAGSKYVIRTEVLYEVDRKERAILESLDLSQPNKPVV